jgi:hypothetical protein
MRKAEVLNRIDGGGARVSVSRKERMMDGTAPATRRMTATRTNGSALAVPNLLTYARIAAVPLIAACLFWVAVFDGCAGSPSRSSSPRR